MAYGRYGGREGSGGRGGRYWESQEALVGRIGAREVRFYPEAPDGGRFQVVALMVDQETGELRPYRSVTLAARHVARSDAAVEVLRAFLDAVEAHRREWVAEKFGAGAARAAGARAVGGGAVSAGGGGEEGVPEL